MHIDSIHNGIVIDHITAGRGMEIYKLLHLDRLDSSVAIIKNAPSRKMGKKDIIKVDADIDIDTNVLGNGHLAEKRRVGLPTRLTNVLFCKNPRCITTTEQELPHVFLLTDPEHRIYRCLYCETKAK